MTPPANHPPSSAPGAPNAPAAAGPSTDSWGAHLTPEMVSSFLSSVPYRVYSKDSAGHYTAASRSHLHRHGLSDAAEFIGRTDADFLPPEQVATNQEAEAGIRRTGLAISGEKERTVRPDGSVTWDHTVILPLHDERQQVIGTCIYSEDITPNHEAEQALQTLRRTQQDLVAATRTAGMAEVATGVLHNVGNVLNSLNVSATLVETGLRQSKIISLEKLAALWGDCPEKCAAYLAHDPKGSLVPGFLTALAGHLHTEQDRLLLEMDSLLKNIDHIKAVIAIQQNIASVAGLFETLSAQEMMEDAVRMTTSVIIRPGLSVEYSFAPVPPIRGDKAKVLQILVNLIRNARFALDESTSARKTITLRIEPDRAGVVRLVVADNGIGIAPENMSRIFQHGFTTRKNGHGFGLHSAINSAKEMGGSLTVHSAGTGCGATFTLELPAAVPAEATEAQP